MPPTPRSDVYLDLAIIALRKLPRFVNQRSLDAYVADDYFQSAIERQLEIAGDALAQIRKNDPNLFRLIPDGDLIVGFRNVLAHGYAALDPSRVYAAATTKAPELLKVLEALLTQFPDE